MELRGLRIWGGVLRIEGLEGGSPQDNMGTSLGNAGPTRATIHNTGTSSKVGP